MLVESVKFNNFPKINYSLSNKQTHLKRKQPPYDFKKINHECINSGQKSEYFDNLRIKVVNDRHSMLTPIKSREEYLAILNKVLKYRLFDFSTVSKIFKSERIDIGGYKHINKDFLGLVPYCGKGDISSQINEWLTLRYSKDPVMLGDKEMANIIRAFDYSLKELDKKYGKFEGPVYRAGYFNPNFDRQYYSASYFLTGAIDHAHNMPPSYKMPYSIIKVKNGHDIHSFQKDTASKVSLVFANSEREILIDRKSRFRKVPFSQYTEDDLYDIKRLILNTTNLNDVSFSSKGVQNLLNFISVWEEV